MISEKIYVDSDNKKCTLYEMVKTEPEWAVNRIIAGEKAIEKLSKLETTKHEPLSDEKIKYIAIDHFGTKLDGNDFMFARAIEKAHGIGE
ncbi:MAG: hypothetical protein WC622_16540 [Pedobacter sp.]|jgi:hypothetical protein|uniref:hypothetical protein n=1 Tax=Pedobacter sp. TaxID=1411316 RepID=UPI0035658AAC